jgi:hypothetical protein
LAGGAPVSAIEALIAVSARLTRTDEIEARFRGATVADAVAMMAADAGLSDYTPHLVTDPRATTVGAGAAVVREALEIKLLMQQYSPDREHVVECAKRVDAYIRGRTPIATVRQQICGDLSERDVQTRVDTVRRSEPVDNIDHRAFVEAYWKDRAK